MHTVRIATNPRKWRRPAPCPACRKSRPLILTLGAIYNLRTRKPVNTIYGCICPNCRHNASSTSTAEASTKPSASGTTTRSTMSIPDRRRKARCCTAEIAKNGTYHGFPSPKSKPYGAAAPNGGYASSTANHTRQSSGKCEGKRNESEENPHGHDYQMASGRIQPR